jgi:hypothetical protein
LAYLDQLKRIDAKDEDLAASIGQALAQAELHPESGNAAVEELPGLAARLRNLDVDETTKRSVEGLATTLEEITRELE